MHLNPKGPLRTQCDSPRPPLVRKATIEPPQNQYTYPIEQATRATRNDRYSPETPHFAVSTLFAVRRGSSVSSAPKIDRCA